MADTPNKEKFIVHTPQINVREVSPDGLPVTQRPKFVVQNPKAEPPIDPNAPMDFSAIEMLKNFPESLKQEASDIANALLNLGETGESLLNVVIGGVQKLDPTGLSGDDKIKYANAVGEYYALKYGSFNAFKRELQNNPASVLSDASLFITGGAGLVGKTAGITSKLGGKTKVVSDTIQDIAKDTGKFGTAVDPLNVAINVPSTAIGQGLRPFGVGIDWGSKSYETALKPSTKLGEAEASQIIKTGLDEGITLDRSGVIKAEKRIDELSAKIDRLLDLDPEAKISSKVALKYLDDLEIQASGPTYDRAKNISDVRKVRNKSSKSLNDFRRYIGNRSDDLMSAKDLQIFKRSIYDKIDWDITKQGSQTFWEQKALKEVGRGAKEGIEEVVPSVKDLNEQLGNLLEAKPHLQRARRRIANRDKFGLNSTVKVGAGSVAGGPAGTLAGLMWAMLDQPWLYSKGGIKLHQYSNQPIKGLLDNKAGWALARNSLSNAGELFADDNGLLSIEDIRKLYEEEELEDNE